MVHVLRAQCGLNFHDHHLFAVHGQDVKIGSVGVQQHPPDADSRRMTTLMHTMKKEALTCC